MNVWFAFGWHTVSQPWWPKTFCRCWSRTWSSSTASQWHGTRKKDGFQVANVPARCLFIKLCDLCFFVAAVLDCDGQNLPISMHPHSSSNKSVFDLQEGLQYIAVDSVAEVCSHHSLLPWPQWRRTSKTLGQMVWRKARQAKRTYGCFSILCRVHAWPGR